MGQKKLAVFTGDYINKGYFAENVWPFRWPAKKSGLNNEVAVLAGFHCTA